MKNIVVIAVLLLLAGCHARFSEPQAKYDKWKCYHELLGGEAEERDGLRVDKDERQSRLRGYRIEYFEEGAPSLVFVWHGYGLTECTFGDEGVVIVSYGPWGEKAAEAVYDGETLNGSVWTVITGANGVKSSTVSTVRNGELVGEEEFKLEELQAMSQ